MICHATASQQHTEGLDEGTFQSKLSEALQALPQDLDLVDDDGNPSIVVDSLDDIKSAINKAFPTLTSQELQVCALAH